MSEADDYFYIEAHCDGFRINGSVEIVEIPEDEIEYYLCLFGNFDSMSGIIIEPGSMRSVLSELCLTNPVPTTKVCYMTNEINYDALKGVLRYGTFFFEEINNSTRFRIVVHENKKKKIIKIIKNIIPNENVSSGAIL